MPPPDGDGVLDEATTRIRAELIASGVPRDRIDCRRDAPPAEGGCPDGAVYATIALAREDGVAEIDVSLAAPGGLEKRRHVRVLARDGGDDPSVLAGRAVELLRDLQTSARPRVAAGPAGPARDDEEPMPLQPPPQDDEPPKPPARRWRLGAGVAALASPALRGQGVAPAPGPVLSAGVILTRNLSLALTGAGPFGADIGTVAARDGKLAQALATLELRGRLTVGPVEPFAAVLTGVNYVRETVTGGEMATSVASAWVPAFGAGIGLSAPLWRRFVATLEIDAFVTQPQLVAYVDNNLAARTGAPSVLVTVTGGLALP
ncbi:MAG TPA: hypothetical protein VHO06_08160, partial [Polyangia bacterium]|nr:hypothetical protein [Polyangia bacterium]